MKFLKFTLKYIFRTIHVLCFTLIAGNIWLDYIFGKRQIRKLMKPNYTILYAGSCVFLVISGLINMILLVKENNYVKDKKYFMWKHLIIFKLALSLLLTPVLEKAFPLIWQVSTNTNEHFYVKLRAGITLFTVLLSPFLRYFREMALTPQAKTVPEAGFKTE